MIAYSYNATNFDRLSTAEYNRLMHDIQWTLDDWCLHNVSELCRAWDIWVDSKEALIACRSKLQEERPGAIEHQKRMLNSRYAEEWRQHLQGDVNHARR